MPAAVPWPPSKPTAMMPPNMAFTPNSGPSSAITSPTPTMYWPQATVWP